ncbi:Cation efflux protein [Corchorus capsularis]|uniref:Cation efflux protein n=1 Tax=Corchorus capsularis TaxID=210143 RepID=A0A1R3GV60_COCAP|nr:Cation efflux protein [Corchorus capsularis]
MEQEEVPILKSVDQMDIEMSMVSESNDIISMPPDSQCCSVCAFSRQENSALESEQRWKSATKLSGLISFYVIVMLVEVIGGVKANSLAVMTDAAHLLSDVAGFSISLFTVRASAWKATSYQSFGTPKEINVEKLENGIKNIEGVQNVHDLHVWAITVGKPVLSCHVVAEPEVE